MDDIHELSPKALLARAVKLEASAEQHEAAALERRKAAQQLRELAAEKDSHR